MASSRGPMVRRRAVGNSAAKAANPCRVAHFVSATLAEQRDPSVSLRVGSSKDATGTANSTGAVDRYGPARKRMTPTSMALPPWL